MSSGLIQHHDVSAHQLGTHKTDLHLPSTRQLSKGHVELVAWLESKGLELLGDPLLGQNASLHILSNPGLGQHVLLRQPVALRLRFTNPVLHESCAKLGLRRETIHLLVVDGTHKRRLAAIVSTEQSVAHTTLQIQSGIVQQRERAVAQGEHAVAQILALLVFGFLRFIILQALQAQSQGSICQLGLQSQLAVHALPRLLVELAALGHALAESSNKVCQTGDRLLDLPPDQLQQSFLVNLANFSLLGSLHDLVRSLSDTAGFRVRNVLRKCRQDGQQVINERMNLTGMRHQLGHVVDNNTGLALDNILTNCKAAKHHGYCQSQSRGLDGTDEDDRSQLLDSGGNHAGILHALSKLLQERIKIRVASGRRHSSHGSPSSSLHVVLGVLH
mmetsp:Transcript_54576/g.145756  ORF Transcript_54576/g.145756 Transcript_54576/m.145756 type:complete len:388 (-) Transcript_54576:455-1618(-)